MQNYSERGYDCTGYYIYADIWLPAMVWKPLFYRSRHENSILFSCAHKQYSMGFVVLCYIVFAHLVGSSNFNSKNTKKLAASDGKWKVHANTFLFSLVINSELWLHYSETRLYRRLLQVFDFADQFWLCKCLCASFYFLVK